MMINRIGSIRASYWIGGASVAAALGASALLLRLPPGFWSEAGTASLGAITRIAASAASLNPLDRLAQPVSSPPRDLAANGDGPPPATPGDEITAAIAQKVTWSPDASVSATPETDSESPGFDVVRVDPSGETLVAGHSKPRAAVELRDGGSIIASVTADDMGQFVILTSALSRGSHTLELAARDGAAATLLSKTMTIKIAAAPENSLPSQLSSPTQSGRPPASGFFVSGSGSDGLGRMAVLMIDATRAGRLGVKGRAEPNSLVRLYLNGSFLADAVAGEDGLWSLTIERGILPGRYAVRAEEIDHKGTGVEARSEIALFYPEHSSASSIWFAPSNAMIPPISSAPMFTPSTSQPLADLAATERSPSNPAPRTNVILPNVVTATVARGDSLWLLSRRFYNDGMRYHQIVSANAAQIHNPSLIYPGQLFVVPRQDQ
jgi:hypothetical protein